MLPTIGKPTHALPRRLLFTRDLEEFEGPILSEYRTEEGGGAYLEKWCARDDATQRFLLVRSDLRSIAQYMARRLTMLQLLSESSDGVGWLIDRSFGAHNRLNETFYVVTLDELPSSYMPEADALHDESLRPRWHRTLQSFLLGRDWSGEQIVAIERAYLDTVAFNHFASENSDNHVAIPERVLQYKYRRGFPVGAAFRLLRADTPHEERGKSVGVAAGSPGVLSIDVSTRIAENIIESMRLLERAKPLYDVVQDWAKQDMTNDPVMPPDAEQDLKWFAEALNLRLSRFGEPLRVHVVGKLLTAYFRKLLKLARPPGEAEFLGVDPSLVPSDVFVSEDEDD